jgi:hypothetical protein
MMPCIAFKVNRHFGETCSSSSLRDFVFYLLNAGFLLRHVFEYHFATYFSEMYEDIQRAAWRYVLDDRTLRNYQCEIQQILNFLGRKI